MGQPSQPLSQIHHCPLYLTPFIGREAELTVVARLLAGSACRLLTLLGPGGIGKTRLALEAAARMLPHFPDGIWLADLAPLCDAELVPQALAAALGVRDPAGRPLLETLAGHLQTRHLLLVLDNCEHLLDGCRQAAHALLAACPGLQVLATSREPLHIAGEEIFAVPPLSQPDLDRLPTLDQLGAYEAIALFVDRAQRAFPAFTLAPHNAAAIAQICCRLDGLPLAIELAAARIRMLSVAQIAERLDDRFRLLTAGSPAVPARQQTLRATLDWSYDLLSPAEQILFRRLAVFAGGFDLEAAEEVCPGEGDGLQKEQVLDLLSQLEAKSLLVVERPPGSGRRYALLETVRGYALDRLRASGEQVPVADRHLAWYLALAEQAEPQTLWGAVEAALLERVAADRENWRLALQWSIARGRAEQGLRLAAALAWFWHVRADLQEGRRWLAQALAIPGKKRALLAFRAKALSRAGALAVLQGDYEQGAALQRRALSLARKQKDSPLTAWGLQELGLVALYSGNYACAEQTFAHSLSLFWEAHNQIGVANLLLYQGLTACYQGHDTQAAALLETSCLLLQDLGDTVAVVRARHGLGLVARRLADPAGARESFAGALRIAWETGARLEIALCLESLAGLASEEQPERAARLFGAAEGLRQAIGSGLPPGIRAGRDEDLVAVRARLDREALAAAWAAGRALTLDQAVTDALAGAEGDRYHLQAAQRDAGAAPATPSLTPLQDAKHQHGGLTTRERQVAALVARGKSNAAIGAELVITVRTVEAHVTHILQKLGFSSRTQVAAWAVARGLAPPPQAWKEEIQG